MDLCILTMRTDNRTWFQDDIVDVFPVSKDPGDGAAIHPRHAVIIVTGIPITDTPENFERAKQLLVQANYADDANGIDTLDRRRWRLAKASFPMSIRNKITNEGRAEVTWTQMLGACVRKMQGINPSRSLTLLDLTNG